MEVEMQVCDSTLGNKLKELGVKQDSHWYWQHNCVNGRYYLRDVFDVESSIYPYERYCSAFTVAELGEILDTYDSSGYCVITYNRCGKAYMVTYENSNMSMLNVNPIIADTEADARAKMLIWLIENNKVKLTDSNLRSEDE